jgi:Fic family protein
VNQRCVGIAKGNEMAHIAPPASQVPDFRDTLTKCARTDMEFPAPIRPAVCKYEMEFFHPFEDGNGRTGRLWHSLILQRHHPLFAHGPVESVIRGCQTDFYAVFGQSDKAGHSTAFIECPLRFTSNEQRSFPPLASALWQAASALLLASL